VQRQLADVDFDAGTRVGFKPVEGTGGVVASGEGYGLGEVVSITSGLWELGQAPVTRPEADDEEHGAQSALQDVGK
jgi:hypothetical protein